MPFPFPPLANHSEPAQAIEDAALDVLIFAKTHDYPQENTPGFFEFTRLIDQLESAVTAKYPQVLRNLRQHSKPESPPPPK